MGLNPDHFASANDIAVLRWHDGVTGRSEALRPSEAMAPSHLRHVTPETVQSLLSQCLHAGCRGATLDRTQAGQQLIETFVPEYLFQSWSRVDRAFAVERLLVEACDSWGGPRGTAATCVLGLSPSVYGKSLTTRREEAAREVGQSGEGFRRKHERNVLQEVAFEAIRLAADLPYAQSSQLRLQLAG